MACNGCFNGCAEIVSDQCVKYTGATIASLGIENGDTLAHVESHITDWLVKALNGTGIIPIIEHDLCELIHSFMPTGNTITLNDVLTAIMEAVCSLQTQVTAVADELDVLNDTYAVDCLDDVTGDDGTHDILQAVIVKLCKAVDDITALENLLDQYVKIVDLHNDIEDYLNNHTNNYMYAKMVPYAAIEYYGPLTNYPVGANGFANDGKGYGLWDQVYLCNGNYETPNKKGRIPVGATSMGGPVVTSVDPAVAGNQYYELDPGTVPGTPDVYGTNTVTLSVDEMPKHTHLQNTVTVVDPGHRHIFGTDDGIAAAGGYTEAFSFHTSFNDTGHNSGGSYYTKSESGLDSKVSQITGVTVSLTLRTTGEGDPHNNIPPVMACYYIMYIPTP